MRLIAALLLLAATPSLAGPATMDSQPLPLARVFASPALSGSVPRLTTIAPDGRHLALLKPRADDLQRHDLWLIDIATNTERLLVDSTTLSPATVQLSEAELMRRERARLAGSRGIIDYQWAPDGQALLVPLDDKLWLVPLTGSPRLLAVPEGALDPRLSPKGRYVSYVHARNLHLLDLSTNTSRAVTTDGGGLISYGLAEFIAQEEMARTRGHWVSPDDSRIAIARVDETNVKVAVRAAIGATTKVTEQRYPFAGTPNARVTLAVYSTTGSTSPVSIDLGDAEYLARVKWLGPDRLFIVRQPRDQSHLDLLQADLTTGQTRLLHRTTSPTWVDLHNSLAAIPMSPDLVWLSEQSGHRHLTRLTPDGTASPLTSGDWSVSELLALTPDNHLLFTGFADTPLEKALYKAPLDGSSPPIRLSPKGHWSEAVADSKGTQVLLTSSSPAQPPRLDLIDTASRTSTTLAAPSLADIPYAPHAADHVLPEFGTLKAADGISDLPYSLLKPKTLKRGAKAPVFVEVYGGPGHQQVRSTWGSLLHQWLVRQGWVVFTLDNRGTPNRGNAFRDAIHKKLGQPEVEDQIAGLQWLKSQPFVDSGRIAVYGWSYGGYMVLRLMTKHPEAFAAGIAGAPVTDWTLYDTHYTERYLGNPATDMAPYAASDTVADAANLARPLLMVHGLSDDNVIFDHSARMIAALQQAGKPFEVMPYPGQAHSLSDPALRTHLWETIQRFLGPLWPAQNGFTAPKKAVERISTQ
jgi:dipeptidyl-peptidase-4